jgi:exonuclease III
MLENLCIESDIIFIQEHWLLPNNLNSYYNVKYSGFAISGIVDIEQFVQRGGRPYGGVGILWKKVAPFKCSVLGFNDSHRCLIIKIEGCGHSLVCVNVYLPTYVNSDEYEEELLDCFAFIDSILIQNVSDNVVLFGDFNFDVKRLESIAKLNMVLNFLHEYNLTICDHLDVNKLGYTFYHEGLNMSSLIDHAFVSANLFDSISNYAVLDSGLNFSDHLFIYLFVHDNTGGAKAHMSYYKRPRK